MRLLVLLLCYARGDDQENVERCAATFGPSIRECMAQNEDYYGKVEQEDEELDDDIDDDDDDDAEELDKQEQDQV